jgi:hypothetical protein
MQLRIDAFRNEIENELKDFINANKTNNNNYIRFSLINILHLSHNVLLHT